MDLFDVARSCIRRWYVVLPLLLITGWFAHSAYASVKPVYYSSAVISLSPPSTRVDQTELGAPVPRNGLLDVGGASLIANMAAIGLNDPSVVQRVVAAGGEPSYVSKLFPVPATAPPLPLIMIETTQSQPDDATKTIELVIAQADSTLRNLQQQARVPDDQMVEPFVVSPPSFPWPGMPSRTRSTLSIFLFGAGLSVLIGTVLDVVLLRRKSRKLGRRLNEVDTPRSSMFGDEGPGVEPSGAAKQDEPAPTGEGVMGGR